MGWWANRKAKKLAEQQVSIGTAYAFPGGFQGKSFDGEQFWRGITGLIDEVGDLDYEKLRERSGALFRTNNYAVGLITRLVDNVIHNGIHPEWLPESSILGIDENVLSEWSDRTELQYDMFSRNKNIDIKGYRTDAELQAAIYREAFIDGDALILCVIDQETMLPKIQIVNASRVRTPSELSCDESIVHGVKVDKYGKHLGYYVFESSDYWKSGDKFQYISCYGAKSGRHQAWMVYGPLKREGDVRGTPALAPAIQSLNEILKYRHSAQLKAAISANIIGFIKRTQEKGRPASFGQAAVKREVGYGTNTETGEQNKLNLDHIAPGFMMSYLNVGEEPVSFGYQNATDISFPNFESAILSGVAWMYGMPPEIMLLSFNSNFSASQAALREFNMKLDKERLVFASNHCQNLAEEWFMSMVLLGNIKADGFVDAYFDKTKFEIKQSWLSILWTGTIKPSLKLNDEVSSHRSLIEAGWTTNSHACRALTGLKFDRVIKKLYQENLKKAQAIRPLLELEQEFGQQQVKTALNAIDEDITNDL